MSGQIAAMISSTCGFRSSVLTRNSPSPVQTEKTDRDGRTGTASFRYNGVERVKDGRMFACVGLDRFTLAFRTLNEAVLEPKISRKTAGFRS